MNKFMTLLILLTVSCNIYAKNTNKKKKRIVKEQKRAVYRYRSRLSNPHEILYNPASSNFYVSNIDGKDLGADGTASIVEISFKSYKKFRLSRGMTNQPIRSEKKEGEKSILNAPKGMLIFNNHLLIADLNAIIVFQLQEEKKPKYLGRISLKKYGAKNLNFIISDEKDNIFISDTNAHQIYRITEILKKSTRKITTLKERIKKPCGMIYQKENNSLLVVSKAKHILYELDLETEKITKKIPFFKKKIKFKTGFCDLTQGNQNEFYITHPKSGMIFTFFREGDKIIKMKPFLRNLSKPTGIIYDANNNYIIFAEKEARRVSFYEGLDKQ